MGARARSGLYICKVPPPNPTKSHQTFPNAFIPCGFKNQGTGYGEKEKNLPFCLHVKKIFIFALLEATPEAKKNQPEAIMF
jgi:hypothetical protein